MWSLRGAQRRDLRHDGREFDDGIPGEFHPDGSPDNLVCDGDNNTENLLPLSRSPVYPPEILINSMLDFSVAEYPSEDSTPEKPLQNSAMADVENTEQEYTDYGSRCMDTDMQEEYSDKSDSDSDSDTSDSENELVYGVPWKTFTVTLSKENIEQYEKLKLANHFFKAVMRDFKPLYCSLLTPDRILNVVCQIRKPMTLRYPEHWYLLPQKASQIRVLKNVNLSEYVCCDTHLIPLGPCAARSPDLQFRETPCAALMDMDGRFYIYDAETDAVFFAANNIEELARFGLSRCEPVYRDGGAMVPMPRPKKTVKKLLSAAIIGLENVSDTVNMLKGTTVTINGSRPDAECTFQIFGVNDLKKKLPFAIIPETLYKHMLEYINFRLCEPWVVIGGFGQYAENHIAFLVQNIVILGARGTVYEFCISKNDVFRVSDDLSTLFKRGKPRIPNRFDRMDNGELRLEHKPCCPHSESYVQGLIKSAGIKFNRRDIEGCYHWLIRQKTPDSYCVNFASIEEAKRQCGHPAKSIPVMVVSGESYQPRQENKITFNSLSKGTCGFRYARIIDETMIDTQRDFYRRWMRNKTVFDDGIEPNEQQVMMIRAERLSALQKGSVPLKLPPISKAIVQCEYYEGLMSDC